MTLTFYFAPNSTANVTAAILSELEHNLPHPLADRIELSLSAGDTRTTSYLTTINPNGRVPALVHDGVPIWESAALTLYLGETFGVEKGLYPALGTRRGEAMKWVVWANTTLVAAAGVLAGLLPAGTPGGNKEGGRDVGGGAEESARKKIEVVLGVLEGGLKGREYLLGEGYCLADTHVWCFVDWMVMMGVDLGSYPNVKGWVGRVGARPALKDL